MKLIIKKLFLSNWKGKREFTLIPQENVTSVHGTNKAGKSTICDAWSWLWTGKDTKGRADFEIKTRDENGDNIHRLEHMVAAEMEVDGTPYTVGRTYQEQWVKPTGEENQVLKSHTTTFNWDSIPLTLKKDFDVRVDKLFGGAEQFQLLSNPRYFLDSKDVSWQKRRKLLMDLAGVTDDAILAQLSATNPDFASLIAELGRNTLDDFRKKLNADKKRLREEIEKIPIRIREATLAIPEEPDYNAVQTAITTKEAEIKAIDEQIADISKAFEGQAERIKAHQNSILEKERRLNAIRSEVTIDVDNFNRDQNKELNELNAKLVQLDTSIRSLTSDQALLINKIHNKESEIKSQKELLQALRTTYNGLNSLVMLDSEKQCPACGQELPEDKLEGAVLRFNADKAKKVQANIEQGKNQKAVLESLEEQLSELQSQKAGIAESIMAKHSEKSELLQAIEAEKACPRQDYTVGDLLSKNAEFERLISEVAELKANAPEFKQPDTTELRQKKSLVQRDVDELKKQLYIKGTAETQRKRISDLETELKTLSQELATLEGKEFIADKFNRAKIEAIENGINGLFATIKWRMFSPLMNGGEEECCEALIDGVPYQTANNAAQINAGIECINTLSKHFDMYLPILIDNAESLVEVIDSESQIIKFIVDGDCAILTVRPENSTILSKTLF
jgi:DNA repair exonuclease SbcCD ATPase subunit